MKLRVIRSEQEMTFPKAYEILHQSFPSKICIYMHQRSVFKEPRRQRCVICHVSKI